MARRSDKTGEPKPTPARVSAADIANTRAIVDAGAILAHAHNHLVIGGARVESFKSLL